MVKPQKNKPKSFNRVFHLTRRLVSRSAKRRNGNDNGGNVNEDCKKQFLRGSTGNTFIGEDGFCGSNYESVDGLDHSSNSSHVSVSSSSSGSTSGLAFTSATSSVSLVDALDHHKSTSRPISATRFQPPGPLDCDKMALVLDNVLSRQECQSLLELLYAADLNATSGNDTINRNGMPPNNPIPEPDCLDDTAHSRNGYADQYLPKSNRQHRRNSLHSSPEEVTTSEFVPQERKNSFLGARRWSNQDHLPGDDEIDGFGQGRNQGHNQTYDQGHYQGHNQTYDQGQNKTHNQGHNQGYNQGYSNGTPSIFQPALITTSSGHQVLDTKSRNSDRCIIDDHHFAALVWERIRHLFPDTMEVKFPTVAPNSKTDSSSHTTNRPSNSRIHRRGSNCRDSAMPPHLNVRFQTAGLNERCRILRYQPGHSFPVHCDGCFQRRAKIPQDIQSEHQQDIGQYNYCASEDEIEAFPNLIHNTRNRDSSASLCGLAGNDDQGEVEEMSLCTLMIYLNDGGATLLDDPAQQSDALPKFQGGQTRFYDRLGLRHNFQNTEYATYCDVVPKAGRVLIFDHDLYHEGVMVKHGVKFALRTDIMFRPIWDQ